MRTIILGLILGWSAAGALIAAPAGEPTRPPEQARIAPLTDEQIKAELAKETPEQKKLRAELVELAKAGGQRIFYNSSFDEKRQKLYAVKPDGSDFACITPKDWTDNQEYPHAFPDGKKLVFTSGRKLSKDDCLKLPSDPRFLLKDGKRNMPRSAAWTMNVDGTDAKPVAMTGTCPHVSASGKYLVYCVQPMHGNDKWLAMQELATGKESIFKAAGNGITAISLDDKYFICGGNVIRAYRIEEILGGELKPQPVGKFGATGCNQEITPDGKFVVHVIDWATGSGIFRVPFDLEKRGKDEPVDLGWPKDTDNYFPDVSPDCKYMVYGHWKSTGDQKDRYSTTAADLYVTRWPPEGVSVRITWHGGTTQNPHWWGPKSPAKQP